MRRHQLEHLIRAASTIADDNELVIIGSQSILGTYTDAPDVLLVSEEADIYPKHYPQRADLIDGSIGELSPFHDTFGYYAQGVSPSTAVLPKNWEERLVAINTPGTNGATGWCLDPHDLAVSKLVAGREKDLRFVEQMAAHGMLKRRTLEARAHTLAIEPSLQELVQGRIRRLGLER